MHHVIKTRNDVKKYKDVSSNGPDIFAPLVVAVTGVSRCGLIVQVYLLVIVCVVVYLFSHTPGTNIATGWEIFGMVIIQKHNMSTNLFCSKKMNEAVLLLGKGVGVTVVSNGLGVLRKRFDEIQ